MSNIQAGQDESGSAYRWVILLVTWAAFLLSFIDRLAWGNVAVSVGASLGMSIAALGVFVTAFYVGYVAANAIGGFFTDWLGGRLMLMAALVPLGVFTFLFSFTESVVTGLVLQGLMGLSAGVDYSACVKLITSWFGIRDRGRAMGLFLTGSSLGVVTTNLIVPPLLTSLGWTGVYRGLGIMTSIFGVICFLALRDSPSKLAQKTREKPQFALLFRNRDLLFLALAGFGALWGTWGFAFWANALMIKGHHLSVEKAGYIVAFFGIGAVIAKPLVGLISDWLGGIRKVPSIICLAVFVLMLLIFGRLETESAFLIAAPLLGVTAFVYSPLMAAMIAEAAGRSLAGSATGLTNAIWQLGSVIVPLAVGFVFQATQSFNAAFITLAAGPLFGLLCMLVVREPEKF